MSAENLERRDITNLDKHREALRLHHQQMKSLRKELLNTDKCRMAWEYICEVAEGVAPYDKGRYLAAKYIVDQSIGIPKATKDEGDVDIVMLVSIINKMLAKHENVIDAEEVNEQNE